MVTNKDFFDVKKEYKKFFDDLIKCNIIFLILKAADFINSNLDDIDNWWFGDLTQKKIKNFCYHICRYEGNLNNGLSSLINLLK